MSLQLLYDSDVDIAKYYDDMQKRFYLHKNCLNRGQIETTIENSMNALKINKYGKLFFVPKSHIHMADILEDFISELNRHIDNTAQITANSIVVANDSKQQGKIAEEFYSNVRKDIELFRVRVNYLIDSNSESTAIMNRWVNKIAALEDKKRLYEGILQRELVDFDDEFADLKFLSQELQLRARKYKRAA